MSTGTRLRYNKDVKASKRHFAHMGVSILASIFFAFLIIHSGVVQTLIASTDGLTLVGSFVAGLFFTSILTTAPAIVVLGELAQNTSLIGVAAVGALGAVCGDYLLFWLVKGGVARDVEYLVSHSGAKRLKALFHTKLFHRLLPLVGALVIASPLPDELGLALLGISKISKERFLLISFIMNFIGIVIIGLVARSI